MNIIDAIKSGKEFRRPGMFWIEIHGTGGNYFRAIKPNGPEDYRPSPDDILADDWEVPEISVVITQKRFWEAFWEAYRQVLTDREAAGVTREVSCYEPFASGLVAWLAKELGL